MQEPLDLYAHIVSTEALLYFLLLYHFANSYFLSKNEDSNTIGCFWNQEHPGKEHMMHHKSEADFHEGLKLLDYWHS
jgi:hypothetical protein